MSTHSGTHIDFPSHFILNGKSAEAFDVTHFILPALVADIPGADAVTSDLIEGIDIARGTALLFRTTNSLSGRCRSGVFTDRYVYLSVGASERCVHKGVSLVGMDYVSIEKYGTHRFDAHQRLLSAGILILEGIDLSAVSAGHYTLICLPIKMKGAEASPARAILIEEGKSDGNS